MVGWLVGWLVGRSLDRLLTWCFWFVLLACFNLLCLVALRGSRGCLLGLLIFLGLLALLGFLDLLGLLDLLCFA